MKFLNMRRARWVGTLSLLSVTLVHAFPYLAQAHSDHKHPTTESTSGKERVKTIPVATTDPYLLNIDPVSGKTLGPLADQVVLQYKGRELRFSNQKNADVFVAAPAKYLPETDRKMIVQQLAFYPLKTCMVSGDALGGDMGPPIDYLHGNRLVRLCCKDCVEQFEENEAEFLSVLDQAVIESQKVSYKSTTCPVSGEPLGSMGDPVDLVVGNRLVRLCCNSCRKTFAKDPVAFMMKLASPAITTSTDKSK